MATVLHESGENYLKAILMLKKQNGNVRAVDLAQFMGVSKPSVSCALARLRDGGYLENDELGYLHLTETGRNVAETIFKRFCFFEKVLLDAGVAPELAKKEACRMEHAVSVETYLKLYRKIQSKGAQIA